MTPEERLFAAQDLSRELRRQRGLPPQNGVHHRHDIDPTTKGYGAEIDYSRLGSLMAKLYPEPQD